ncbi:MAG: diacylglycerol kinase, partial [Comamonadaceae bacterium]|nr:diacylglycerol kinase [Comamonadaceae bacterium]
MRHKFLGIGEPGYHPWHKIGTVFYRGCAMPSCDDWSVTYKLVLSAGVLAGAFMLRAWVDFLLILVVAALVVFAEIVNSAIEALCDFVEERHNEKIKIIKDMAAAAVGVTLFAWMVVIGVELGRYFASLTAGGLPLFSAARRSGRGNRESSAGRPET